MHGTISKTEALAIAQRASASAARHRKHKAAKEGAMVRKGSLILTAGLFGWLQRAGVKPDMKGVPWKSLVFLGATGLEFMSNSPLVSNIAAGVSDATSATYIEDAIRNKTLVAGEGGQF